MALQRLPIEYVCSILEQWRKSMVNLGEGASTLPRSQGIDHVQQLEGWCVSHKQDECMQSIKRKGEEG